MLPVDGLIQRIKEYNSTCDEDAIRRAYEFGKKAHSGQKRASGEPYFAHPVQVAHILADKFLDDSSVIAGLLHDTVEDTDVTLDDVREHFGDDVTDLVNGVTKVSSMVYLNSQETKQAENFSKLLMALSKDIRVLLVKVADRLHNMRTLNFLPRPEKQIRISRETLEVYALLVERVGINDWKEELQGIAFSYLQPKVYKTINDKLAQIDPRIVEETVAIINATMGEYGVKNVEVTGRKKRPYSIWRKMQKRTVSFDQLSDIIAFRVLVADKPSLYQALGAVHGKFKHIPERFKDYVSLPKANGYQSIHTGVLGPNNQRIEIQMRTLEMHRVAELGVASHWSYKQEQRSNDREGKQYRWVRSLLDVVETTQNAEELLENTKLEMYQDSTFVFTPKGDLVSLPKGATPLDFAYQIHSDLGHHCSVARVNGAVVPLRTQLHTGDVVSVETSPTQQPSADWQKIVVSGKAKSHIRRFLKVQKRDDYIERGRRMIAREIIPYQLTEAMLDKGLKDCLPHFKCDSVDDLLVRIGEESTPVREVLFIIIPESKAILERKSRPESFVKRLFRRTSENDRNRRKKSTQPASSDMGIRGILPGIAVKYGKCCHPIPGDKIVGVVVTGTGVTVHADSCDVVQNLSDSPERFLDIDWQHDHIEGDYKYVGRLNLYLENTPVAITRVTRTISRFENIEIHNLKVLNRGIDHIELIIDLAVPNTDIFKDVVGSLRANRTVIYVGRDKES